MHRLGLNPRRILWAIIAIGVLLRVYWACLVLDGVHPDEHYQTLEPAAKLVFGYGWLSWEWEKVNALRSWFVPAFFAPVLALQKIFGGNGGPTAILLCQVQLALFVGAALATFARLLRWLGFSEVPTIGAVTWLTFSPAMIAWASATTTDVMALAFFWLALPWAWRKLEDGHGFAAGFALGISVWTRLQMLALVVPFLVAAAVLKAWRREPEKKADRKAAKRAARPAAGLGVFQSLGQSLGQPLAGLGVSLLPLGLLDWITWGAPFASAWNNLQRNLFENAASFYGTSPWYEYFPKVLGNFGNFEGLVVLATVLALLSGWLGGAAMRRTLPLWIGGGFYLLAHVLIPHKETRFLVPIYPLVFVAFAGVLERLWARFPSPPGFAAGLVALVVGLAPASYGRMVTGDHFSSSSLSQIMIEIRERGGVAPDSCVLFVDHYWVWAQGELLQGKPTPYLESPSARLEPGSPALAKCRFAVLSPGAVPAFEAAAGGRFRLVMRSYWGHLLYQRAP